MACCKIIKTTLNLFSRVLFWFAITMMFYTSILSNNFLFLFYTEREWWGDFYHISSSFLTGGLVSFFFYFLVVYIPEQRKRQIIKDNLKQWYAEVKEDILYQVIFASREGGRTDLTPDSDTVEQLLTIDGFKDAFDGGREANEGIYAFLNRISEDVPEYQEIIWSLHVLSNQINYVLHNYPITDTNAFDFFKRLEVLLARLEHIGPGYDEANALARLIREIFAGFSVIEGNRGYDIVEKMIEDI